MNEMGNELITSVTRIDNSLMIALPAEMTDDNVSAITELSINKAYDISISGAILNFSMVKVMDTDTFSAFYNLTKALSLMGVHTVWACLSPGVVTALMDLNIEIDTKVIQTTSNLENGLELLSSRKEKCVHSRRK